MSGRATDMRFVSLHLLGNKAQFQEFIRVDQQVDVSGTVAAKANFEVLKEPNFNNRRFGAL